MENVPIDNNEKRPRGRPKTGFDKAQYDKQYREEHKETIKKYRQKIFEEKGEQYENLLSNVKKHNQLSRNALKLIKDIKEDSELPEKFKTLINNLLNSSLNQDENLQTLSV